MQYISIIKAEIKSISPLFISDGEDVLLDEENKMAYIPASTIAGAFRAHLDFLEKDSDILFGKSGEKSIKSSVYISDTYTKNKGFERRDGVRIDGTTGSSVKGAKIDRLYLKEGLNFVLKFKIKGKKDNIKLKKDLLYMCLKGLDSSFIRLGGKKSNGLGIFKVKKVEEINFDFSYKSQWIDYVKKDFSRIKDMTKDVLDKTDNNKYVEFTLSGSLSTPVLIGATESFDSKQPDNTSMLSNGKYIIPGSSFKGLLRGRVETIGNYFGNAKIGKEIFGDIDNENMASRVIVNESIIDTKDFEEVDYNRIKIDKFTGGVRNTGLMDERPVQGDVEFKLIYKLLGDKKIDSYAVGIIALALRDLGMEDLSIGAGYSIGRGRYKADTMSIYLDEEKIEIDFNNKKISNEIKLNNYINTVKTFRYEEGGNENI